MMWLVLSIPMVYGDRAGILSADAKGKVFAEQCTTKLMLINSKDQAFIDKIHAQSYQLNVEDKAFVAAIGAKPLDQAGVGLTNTLNKEKTLKAIQAHFPESKKRCFIEKDHEDKENIAPARNGVHLYIFMSFGIPAQVWQDLFKAWSTYPFTFVVRGLPNDSFEALGKKIQELQCPVDLNPELFERYQVDKVPTFVFVQEEQHEGVMGNVSLACVLDHVKEKGQGIGRRYAA